MESCLRSAELDLLMPADSALRTHCRRVAAVALEMARFSEIPIRLAPILEQAALLHHADDVLLNSSPLARLAWDVCHAGSASGTDGTTGSLPELPQELSAVLSLVHGQPASGGGRTLELLSGMVRLCNLVDEQLEAQWYGYQEIDAMLEEVESLGAFEGFDPSLMDLLRRVRFPKLDLRISEGRQLPVEARAAQQVFRRLGPNREYEVGELEGIATQDPVLVASLIRVANAALYSPEVRIGTVRQAISYVGTGAARRVMLAAVLRPLLASASLSRMWMHCLNMAKVCSAMAEQSGLVDAEEASLLGVIHDFGALVIQILARDALDAYGRLSERGCPPAYIEQLLFGRDHGEIGAQVLAEWDFPEHLVEAVRFHHQPERSGSPAASIVYLAEFWAGLNEDIPSAARVRECISRTGVSLESLAGTQVWQNALGLLQSVA